MSSKSSNTDRRRERRLAGAFGLILMAQVGLYFAASHESQLAIWLLFTVQGAGMLIALRSA